MEEQMNDPAGTFYLKDAGIRRHSGEIATPTLKGQAETEALVGDDAHHLKNTRRTWSFDQRLPSVGVLAGNRRSARIASELKLKEKTEAYESMMEHFQLRKLHRTFSADDGSRFSSSQSISSVRERAPSEDQQVRHFRRTWPLDQSPEALDDSTCTEEHLAKFSYSKSHSFSSQGVTHPSSTRLLSSDKLIPPMDSDSSKKDRSSHHDSQSGNKGDSVPSRWSVKRYARMLLKHARQYAFAPMAPESLVSRVRWLVLMLTCLAQLVYLPLVPIYFSCDDSTVITINAVFECIFLSEMLFCFNSSYFDSKMSKLVTSRREIAVRYLRGWFVLDALSAVPIDTLRLLAGVDESDLGHYFHVIFHAVFRIPRLLHSFRLITQLVRFCLLRHKAKGLFTWLMYSRYSHLMRIVWLVLLVILTSHYMACCWHWITGDNPNAPNAVAVGAPVWEQYLSDMYYCTLLLQGQGEYKGTTPTQNLFSTFSVLLGSVILAIVFGNVAMLVSNFNANSTNYQRKMEVVFATMNKLQLPHDLRERIHLYYDHLWQEYESLDGDIVKFSKELTHTLALEVGLYRYMNLIMKVPYWRECSPDFVTQVVLNLVARVYLPDDYVVRQGEIGEEMYMVNRGLCEFADVTYSEDFYTARDQNHVGPTRLGTIRGHNEDEGIDQKQLYELPRVDSLRRRHSHSNFAFNPSKISRDIEISQSEEDEACVVHPAPSPVLPSTSSTSSAAIPDVGKRISTGETFGEMALLMNHRSMISVRAVTYVEMCVLDRTKFQQILARYPDDRRRVSRLMLSTCVEKREMPFSRGEICQMVARKRQVSVLSVLDESDGFSKDELVEALLDRMDQPLMDQSIVFGCQSHQDTPGSIKSPRLFPRLRRRRSSSRTPVPSSSCESIMSVLTEYQRGMETHFDAFGLRMQELERNQSQMMDLLRRIASQPTPM